MTDVEETLGGSRIQHGPYNDRVYLMSLDEADLPWIIDELDSLARENGYGKIFAKITSAAEDGFTADGYSVESRIPGGILFASKYLNRSRMLVRDKTREVVEAVTSAGGNGMRQPPKNLVFRHLTAADAVHLARLFKTVFETYPFPVQNPGYLRESMAGKTGYYGFFDGGALVCAGGAEFHPGGGSAEITDIAVHPEYRGRGLGSLLVKEMGGCLRRTAKTLYTICRGSSVGINMVFKKNNYVYAGTIPQNTNIMGSIEDMNVWYAP